MKCEACERGDHDNCGMQTWCECDCEGYQDGIYLPDDDREAIEPGDSRYYREPGAKDC